MGSEGFEQTWFAVVESEGQSSVWTVVDRKACSIVGPMQPEIAQRIVSDHNNMLAFQSVFNRMPMEENNDA